LRIVNDYWFDEGDLERFCVPVGSSVAEVTSKMVALGSRTLAVVSESDEYLGVIGYSKIGDLGSNIDISQVDKGVWCLETSSTVLSSIDFVPILSVDRNVIGCRHRPMDLGREGFPKSVIIIGAGYVGFTLGLALAAKGVKVSFIESDLDRLSCYARGEIPFFEHGLQEVFDNHKEKIEFFDGIKSRPVTSSFVIISVGTPIDNEHQPRLDHLECAVKSAIDVCENGGLICFRSTVPVGQTSEISKKFEVFLKTKNLQVAFCPERTAEGEAIKELSKNPQFIGVETPLALRKAFSLFSVVSEEAIVYPKFELAELAKLADNVSRDIYFGVSNFFARIARDFGFSGSSFVKHLNHNYLRNNLAYPSVGVGGPCLSKDYYLLRASNGFATDGISGLGLGRQESLAGKASMINYVHQLRSKGLAGQIICAGLAFKGKPETSDIRDSIGVQIFKQLVAEIPESVVWFDPIVYDEDLDELLLQKRLKSLPKFAATHIIVLILNNHSRWPSIDFSTCVGESYYCHILDGFNSSSLEFQKIHNQRVVYKPW